MDLQDFDNFCEDLPDLPEMQTVISEARYGLELILPILEQNLKILEIGAGAGLLSGFLHKNGFEVSAIEPGGFSNFEQILDAVCIKTGFRPIKTSATDLGSLEGNFDLIYSIHVLEHINDLRLAVSSMESLLGDTGQMVHLCPNYAIPYEPHIRRFFLPWARPTCDVNFITAYDLEKIGRSLGLKVDFDRGVMADFAKRLSVDEVFKRRQRRLNWVEPLAPFLKLVPAKLATPMVARFKRP